MQRHFSREELIELVEKITDPSHDDESIAVWLTILEQNVPHPEVSGLIFWPHIHGLGSDPSAAEIVDKALEYRPIQL